MIATLIQQPLLFLHRQSIIIVRTLKRFKTIFKIMHIFEIEMLIVKVIPDRTGWTLLRRIVNANRRESLLTSSRTGLLVENM